MGRIRGIIFDLDGVVIDSPLNFLDIKGKIGLDSNEPLLESIGKIRDPGKREKAHQILKEEEKKAAFLSNLNKDIPPLFSFLEKKGIKKALVTRNNREAVRIVLEKFGLNFDVVITREDVLPKPAKEPVVLVCKRLKLSPKEVVLVGDHKFDILAGRDAGVKTILLKDRNNSLCELADVVISSLKEIKDIIFLERSKTMKDTAVKPNEG